MHQDTADQNHRIKNLVVQSWLERCQSMPGRAGFADGADLRVWKALGTLFGLKAISQAVIFIPDDKAQVLLADPKVQELMGHLGPKISTRVSMPGDCLARSADCLAKGELDSVLGGNISTTADVIRAGIRGVGLSPGTRTVSGSFIMVPPQSQEVLLFADSAVVVKPSLEQLLDIALASVETWSFLVPSARPRVAFLSFSTKGSASHEEAEKMRRAAELFAAKRPDILVDGELQFDAAFCPDVALKKSPASPLGGRANCFIFPDLSSGNIGYKLVQRLGGYDALGPILQGLKQPFSDLSRGASVDDIVASTLMNQVRAIGFKCK